MLCCPVLSCVVRLSRLCCPSPVCCVCAYVYVCAVRLLCLSRASVLCCPVLFVCLVRLSFVVLSYLVRLHFVRLSCSSPVSISCVCLVRLARLYSYYPLNGSPPYTFELFECLECSYRLSCSIRLPLHAFQRVKINFFKLMKKPELFEVFNPFNSFGMFGVYGVYGVYGEIKRVRRVRGNHSYNPLNNLTPWKDSH